MGDLPLGWIILALEGLRGIAIRYLEGREKRAALLLSFCFLELAAIHSIHGFDYQLDLTLRCPRPVLEELQPEGPQARPTPLLISIRAAIERGLPTGSRLGRFEARATASLDGEGNLTQTIERIDRNLEAVAQGRYELNAENEELKRLAVAGQLEFVRRVDDKDYVAFAFILALGNRSAAARRLGIPSSSFYEQVDEWRNRDPEHRRMHRLIEWRKAMGRRIIVRLGQSVQSSGSGDEAENPVTLSSLLDKIAAEGADGREDLLRQVLEALRNQNPANWQAVRNELVTIIKDEVP